LTITIADISITQDAHGGYSVGLKRDRVRLPVEIIFFAINLFTVFQYINIFLIGCQIEHQIIKLLINLISDITYNSLIIMFAYYVD